MTTIFKIHGVVREQASRIGIGNVLVKAYDRDLLFDDLLGTGITRADGTFEIVSEARDFRDFFEQRPDIYLRVLTSDTRRQIHSTEHSVRWEAGHVEYFAVDIPAARLGDLAPRVVGRLTVEEDGGREEFEAGDSPALDVRGLVPARVYEVSVIAADGRSVVSSRLITDRTGRLDRIIPWPQLGLGDPGDFSFATPEAAEAALAGKVFTLRVADEGRILFEAPLRFAPAFRRPLLYSSDPDGRVRNGFEIGKSDVHVSGRHLPPAVAVRVIMVRRQFAWHLGDPTEPVSLVGGTAAVVTTRTDPQGAFNVRLALANQLEPGSYQFVAQIDQRAHREAVEMVLAADDVVSGRRLASLVIRRDFWTAKDVRGGCVMSQDMAGRPIVGPPYFKFTNSFQVGEDVWAALDPAAINAGLIGKKVAIYVIEAKDAAGWANTSLQHLPVLGGNPAVQEFVTQAGCINYNDLLVWPNASKGKYEIVADFGNNPPTPATFTRDDNFNSMLDIIDGYAKIGFHVVEDPTTTATFPFVGSVEYNEGTTVIDAPDEYDYTLPVGQQMHKHSLEQKAIVYFPAAFAGATNLADISPAQAQYPLVVVVHGNSSAVNSYKGYNYLLEHLARNGFIAASIHIYPPNPPTWSSAHGVSRARALFKHLEILKLKLPGKIDLTKIGIMGHSRGGEAVVIASKLNVDEALGYNFRAIVSLAPTDQYPGFPGFGPIAVFGAYALTGAYHQPYFVIYGSLDGDLIDGPAFRLYDRSGPLRALLYVRNACHGRFNVEWNDADFYFSTPFGLDAGDQMKVISKDAHQKIAMGYMSAFFRWHLYGLNELADFFTGELVPKQVQAADGGSIELHAQYEAPAPATSPAPIVVDRFANFNWQLNDLGAAVTHNGTLPVNPGEGRLQGLDYHSPHHTTGALIRWDAASDIYLSNVPAASQNLVGYEYLSFRVAQRYGSASNVANATQDFYVKLTDANGNSRSILVSKFATIPYPYLRFRGMTDRTMSALKNVRVPLSAYRIEVLGTQKVDLSQVVSIGFEFAAKPMGEIEINDVQFGY